MNTRDTLLEIGMYVLAGVRNLSWWSTYRQRFPQDDPKLHRVHIGDDPVACSTVASFYVGKLFLFESDMYVVADEHGRYSLYNLNTVSGDYEAVLEGASPFEIITVVVLDPVSKEYKSHFDEDKMML